MNEMSLPETDYIVSVVIPTTGRASLSRAVASAQCQSISGSVEVVVVADGNPEDVPVPAEVQEACHVIWAGKVGGAEARNIGVRQAKGEFIAFLDDDDEWLPEKLEQQVDAAVHIIESGREPVIGSRHRQVDGASGKESQTLPARAYSGGGVANYLFRRRRPAGGRATIYTSTLMCRRTFALHNPWDPALKRHQDWDWLLRAERSQAVAIVQLADPLVRIHTGSTGSISAKTNWFDSLLWADRMLRDEGAHVYADFLAAQCGRYALAARSLRGVAAIAIRLWRVRTFPGPGPVLICLGGLLPRTLLERMMTVIR